MLRGRCWGGIFFLSFDICSISANYIIIPPCAFHSIQHTQLMSYVQPFWRVDQVSSGFWQASRSLLSFFWSPFALPANRNLSDSGEKLKKPIFQDVCLWITLAKTAKRCLKTRKTSANFPTGRHISRTLPVKIRCWIDLSQRQAKAQVQVPFHSKPPISCALDLTFFEVTKTHGDGFFPTNFGAFLEGNFGMPMVSTTWGGEKNNLPKKTKRCPYKWNTTEWSCLSLDTSNFAHLPLKLVVPLSLHLLSVLASKCEIAVTSLKVESHPR